MEVEKLEKAQDSASQSYSLSDGFSGGKRLHWVLTGDDNLQGFAVKRSVPQM